MNLKIIFSILTLYLPSLIFAQLPGFAGPLTPIQVKEVKESFKYMKGSEVYHFIYSDALHEKKKYAIEELGNRQNEECLEYLLELVEFFDPGSNGSQIYDFGKSSLWAMSKIQISKYRFNGEEHLENLNRMLKRFDNRALINEVAYELFLVNNKRSRDILYENEEIMPILKIYRLTIDTEGYSLDEFLSTILYSAKETLAVDKESKLVAERSILGWRKEKEKIVELLRVELNRLDKRINLEYSEFLNEMIVHSKG